MAKDAKKDTKEKPVDQKKEISDKDLEKATGGTQAIRSGGGRGHR